MKGRARAALADCENALVDFEASVNTSFQKTRWIAVMSLLRTVGLVLKEVDHPAASPDVQRRIDTAWKDLNATKPNPRIFHDFIDHERYQVVHLYEINTRVNATVAPIPEPHTYFLATMFDDDEDSGFGWNPTTFTFFMRSGPFTGRDPCELCREAIQFWRNYLDGIDSGAAS